MKIFFNQNIWILLFLIISMSACNDFFGGDDCIRGRGDLQTEVFDLPEFDSFTIRGSMDVVLRQGDTQFVEVRARENILPLVASQVRGRRWEITTNQCTRGNTNITVFITLPDIEGIEIVGSGDVISEGSLDLDAIDLQITGSGDIQLNGTILEQTISVVGSGSVDNFGVQSQNINAFVSGSGDIAVTVSESLEATIVGSGDIFYRGNPQNIQSSVTGSGDLVNAN